ncbi:MAG: class I SAM-dependent methyltransferase [Nocardioidaceae bacterium]
MTSSEVWDEATAERYDASSAEMFAPEVLDPMLDLLERLANDGADTGADDGANDRANDGAGRTGALEFAIGTGRVAIPLAARGVPVSGIELSEPMVRQLRRKVDESRIPVVIGDMATTVVPGEFSLVFLVWNGLSNLRTQGEQVACFRNAAHHLRPGGRFVIELWVPPLRRLPPGQQAVPMSMAEGHLVFDTYDLVSQGCTSHHYVTDPDGTTSYGSGSFRYAWPAECDLMATLAGLEPEARYADCAGAAFTSESESHVSIWRKPS